MNQEVKVINGYTIKDEIARNKIENLKEPVKYIFQKALDSTGDCNIIQYKGKNIVIDNHSDSEWENIKQMLDDNNVRHIDYLIITHYHSDHNGNFMNLLNNRYIDQNTIYFMPADTTAFGESNNNAIAVNKQRFIENGLTYRTPEENEKITIGDDLYLTFVNCDPDKLEQYYPNASYAVNATSTVVIVEHRGTRALYMGDGTRACYNRMLEEGFVKGTVDLFKIGHHGIDPNTNLNFVKSINPKYAVQTSGIINFSRGNYTLSDQMLLMNKIGTIIYPSHIQNDYIIFESNGSMNNIKGKAFFNGGVAEDINIYVDSSIENNDYQDGTEEYPYKDLPQALSIIKNYDCQNIKLHLANGNYCIGELEEVAKENPRITNYSGYVQIDGNSNDNTAVVINYGFVIDSSNVRISNLTINNNRAINCTNSNVSIQNCNMINPDSPGSTVGIYSVSSTVYITSSKLSNYHVGVGNRYGSKLIASSVTYDNIDTLKDNVNISSIIESSNLYSGNTTKYTDLANYTNYPKPITMYKDTSSDYSVLTANLSFLLNKVGSVEILCKTNDGIYTSVRVSLPSNKKLSIQINNPTANDVTMKTAKLNLGTDSITIENQKSINIDSSNNVTYSTGNYFKIVKVTGYINTEIDLS